MNPRLVFLLVVSLSLPAHAQWGVGTALGTGCPYSFRPAPQATDGSDELANIRGYMTRDGQLQKNKESDLARVDGQLRRVKSEMARVISPDGMAAIDQHYSHGLARDRYQTVCPSGPATSREAPPVLPPWVGGPPPMASADATFPIPSGFCYSQGDRNLNLWGGFMADDPGRLNDTICDYPVPPTRRASDANSVAACKNALHDYYQLRAERARIEDELRRVRERMAGYDSRMRVIRDEVTEGRYCPTCNSERRGYSTASTGDQSMQTLGLLAGVALTLFSRHQQQRRPPPPPAYLPPRPGAPAVMPYRAFPQRPYSAPLPGYMGMNNGVDYGSVPGSIGPGAFGCQGTSPLNSSPMFGNAPPTVFGGSSPWDNPFAQPIMNPQLSSPLYNSGFGPTLGPIMNTLFNGLGGQNQMMGNGMVDPFGAPTTLPYWGNYTGNGALVPPLFGNDPFAYDPLGPGMVGAPGSFGPGFGGRGGSAPPVLPYTGSLSAVANGGFSSSFGSPVANYYNQVQQIKSNINQIQNGSYFGSAPTVLPYQGSGTRPNPPPVLPYKNK